MNVSSLVGHIVELAGIVEKNEDATRQKPGRPTDRIVGEFFRDRRYLGANDRRFILRAIYGLVRYRHRLSVLVDEFVTHQPDAALKEPGALRWLPQYVAYAICIEETEPADLLRSLGLRWKSFFPSSNLEAFVEWLAKNKSLDFLDGDDESQLAVWYSFQEWMVREWVEQFGSNEAEDLLNAFNTEAPLVLRVNTLKCKLEDCEDRLKQEGIATARTRYSSVGLIADKRFNIHASNAFRDGLFEVQEVGSQLVALLADPKPGMLVVDACAGAGGKSLMMAQLMHDQGEIVALDVDRGRLNELSSRAQRAGASIIRTRSSTELAAEDYIAAADVVLVDAPCSGVGTIRRNPSLKWTITQNHVEYFSQIQREILQRHAPMVKSGGRLVYATCSLLRKENEEIVEQFLETNPQFVQEKQSLLVSEVVESPETPNYLKLLPHRHGTDGFFAAALRRTN